MPRGQWDRTKSKEQRNAEKGAVVGGTGRPGQILAAPSQKAPKTGKRKYTRHTNGVGSQPVSAHLTGDASGRSMASSSELPGAAFESIKSYLVVLMSCIQGLGQANAPTYLYNEFAEALQIATRERNRFFGPVTPVEVRETEEASITPQNGQEEAQEQLEVPQQTSQQTQAPFPPS